MMRPFNAAAAGFLLIIFSLTSSAPSTASEVSLSLAKRTMLQKSQGQVDQVLLLPAGGYLVRDADFKNESRQKLEYYDGNGLFARRIGSFGRKPGSYYRLKDVAVAKDGTIWVADVIGRLSLFSAQGDLLKTKLIQNPGYQVDDAALDEARGVFYLGGCLPRIIYIDHGCNMVHRYSLKDRRYLDSFLPTDQEALNKKLMLLSDIFLDVDAEGRIWAADAPLLKLARVVPSTNEIRSFPIQSKIAKPIPKMKAGKVDFAAVYRESFLVERVVASGPFVAVAIRRPLPGGGQLLAVFGPDGRQVAADLEVPGRLVGRGGEGSLLFAVRKGQGFELNEYVIRPAQPGKAAPGTR